jgi:GH15 family glucan-1,4-alpha-glucosidase
MTNANDRQPPIADYGYLSDCHSSALVSKHGSIDWCCMPRIDAPSCFGRLLDWQKGGYCQIIPTEQFKVERCYIESTMILATTFETSSGKVKVYDFLPMKKGAIIKPYQQILRIIEGLVNEVEVEVNILPRFDYGSIRPWIKRYKGSSFAVLGGSQGLLISGNLPLRFKGTHHLRATIKVRPKERYYLSILYRRPEELDNYHVVVPGIDELDFRFLETILWWQTWCQRGTYSGPYHKLLKRSALVLKSLSNIQTGAIAAAATTSLPEHLGGMRNWDYRYSWTRDSCFSVRSLALLGHVEEADNFRRFTERSSHSDPKGVQTLFGVHGEKRLEEFDLKMAGYHNSVPVRIGNLAAEQLQLGIYGLLLDLSWCGHLEGCPPNRPYWLFLKRLASLVLKRWRSPDQSIWEMRGEPRHFVYSKAMCWVAVDRSIKMAQAYRDKKAPIEEWQKVRDDIKHMIEEQGIKDGVFIQAFGYPYMDAALLLLPIFGFIDYNDPIMLRTVAKIQKELDVKGLLLRYPRENDEMPGDEGTFLACTFWLVACLAKQGKKDKAKKYFNNAIATCNELGLFAEEYEPHKKIMLGNFPQGFTHLSLILAAKTLD